MTEHWQPGEAMAAFIEPDRDRARRRGYPEAVYCEGKTPAQVSAVARAVKASGTTTLFTRADPARAKGIQLVLPDARYDEDAHMLAWPPEPPAPHGGGVLVVAAGTSDLGVAREAQLTAQYLGRATELIVDVGIAGLHRILARLDQLRAARVIVVVAGMDGALPSLVAGLVAAPVIAVPTSVGYGAAPQGLAPLLTMLNSCAPGVAVVNIDNDVFIHRLVTGIGAMTAAAGGLDALVFTGGIGEHSPAVRAAAARRLRHLGVLIDAGRNDDADRDADISQSTRSVACDIGGHAVASRAVTCPLREPRPGYAGQDPQVIPGAVVKTVAGVVAGCGGKVRAVSFSSAMHTVRRLAPAFRTVRRIRPGLPLA